MLFFYNGKRRFGVFPGLLGLSASILGCRGRTSKKSEFGPQLLNNYKTRLVVLLVSHTYGLYNTPTVI